jgi:hypothetical protein
MEKRKLRELKAATSGQLPTPEQRKEIRKLKKKIEEKRQRG